MTGTWHHGLIARWWAEVSRPEAAELAYLRAAVARFGEPALDLGCGTGRLLVPLLAEGLDVDGIDISADMLDHARAVAAAIGIDATDRLAVAAFDELDRGRRYGTIFSIGSFAIGGSPARDREAVRRAFDHLAPGGALLLSYEIASEEDHARMADPETPYPRPWPAAGRRSRLGDGDELELFTRAAGYEAADRTHRLEIRARLLRDGVLVREESGVLLNTYYRPETVVTMLEDAGFDDITVEGPYTGRPPDAADWSLPGGPRRYRDGRRPARQPEDPMSQHPRAGQPAQPGDLVDIPALLRAYTEIRPDPTEPAQRVAFGTSGHRGSALRGAFNEAHILATTLAICRYRAAQGTTGPLFLGRDTHALSEPAWRTALELLVVNGVDVRIDAHDGYTPTPAISHAILAANRRRRGNAGLADGIVVTPSHNPPDDGGFKYNPPNGGPADSDVTRWIQDEANRILEAPGSDGLAGIRRVDFERARADASRYDFRSAYVGDLATVVDMDAIRASGLRLGVDPLGGAAVAYWGLIGERYGLDLTVTNDAVDGAFAFMTLDWDGRIRMDPSSPFAMARLVELRDRFDIALGNDADADRHGVVVPGTGLMNPNHVLAAAISYLFGGGRDWRPDVAVGKTLVSSSIIDRVVASLGRRLLEVPVGFKWFVDGLVDGSVGFGGEESAGASFLRRDGSVWTTDKDGIIACLLAAELTARVGRNPAEVYAGLTDRFGAPAYRRIDAPATPEVKAALGRLAPDDVRATTLAGDPITARLTTAPGNGAPIGGLKVVTEHGWFAARPSGTENVTKLYAESFRGEDHLAQILDEARAIVDAAV